jgi:hypothetical protein
MEARFGEDLGQVRVHADAGSAASAKALDAKAYAVGPSIVFGAGKYAPESPQGKRLLAHEITHVLQARRHPPAGRAVVCPPGGPAEAEARGFAAGSRSNAPSAAPGGLIQREPSSGAEATPDVNAAALLVNTLDFQNQAITGFSKGFLDGAKAKVKPGAWDAMNKELSTPGNQAAFQAGTLAGIPEGVVRDVWDLLKGLYELAGLAWDITKWTIPPYAAYRAIKSGFAEGYALYKGEESPSAKQARETRELVEGIAAFMKEVATKPNFVFDTGEAFGVLAGGAAAKWFNEEYIVKTPFWKGYTVGVVEGYLLLEIAMLFVGPEELALKGISAVAKSAKATKAGLEVLKVLEKIPALRRILEAKRATSAARKLEEATRLAEEARKAELAAEEARRLEQAAAEARRLKDAEEARRLEEAAAEARKLKDAEEARKADEALARSKRLEQPPKDAPTPPKTQPHPPDPKSKPVKKPKVERPKAGDPAQPRRAPATDQPKTPKPKKPTPKKSTPTKPKTTAPPRETGKTPPSRTPPKQPAPPPAPARAAAKTTVSGSEHVMSPAKRAELVGQKLQEVDRQIAEARRHAAAVRDSVSPSRWNEIRLSENNRIYKLLERRNVLNRMKAFPNRRFLEQVEIKGVEVEDKLIPAKDLMPSWWQKLRSSRKTPIPKHLEDTVRTADAAQIEGDIVQLEEFKSRTTQIKSVEGGVMRPKPPAAGGGPPSVMGKFNRKSSVGRQQWTEKYLLDQARKQEGRVVLEGTDPLTGAKVTIKVDPANVKTSRVTDYEALPHN